MAWYYALFIALVVGALARGGTLFHTFALMFDMLWQGLIWNDPVGVTLYSRAGLAARKGNTLPARLIGVLFLNKNHCEEAIAADIERVHNAIDILTCSKTCEWNQGAK